MPEQTPNSLLSAIFAIPHAATLFNDQARIQAMLDFESALARAEATLGIIPKDAASTIAACCQAGLIDLPSLAADVAANGNLAIPLVKQLTALVRQQSPEAAGYVHWGATSQDVLDTGLVLQLRTTFTQTLAVLDCIAPHLAHLAREHAQTPMAGRTWMQQAVPIPFGLKVAGWLSALHRDRERLHQLQPRVLALQFGGAAGTLASLGTRGLEVAQALAEDLGLALTDTPWHSARDRVAETATVFGLLAGSLSKIARDLSLLMQTEIAELAEGASGGSSTMPHKRNPVGVAAIIACTLRVPGLVATMLTAMAQENERGLGNWAAEWETLPEICTLTLSALAHFESVLANLQVFPQAMLCNLNITTGLLMAESVSMHLATHIGRDQAHKLLQQASAQAVQQGVPLQSILQQDPQITQHLTPAQLEDLLAPASYLGVSAQMIDRVLASQALPHYRTTGDPTNPALILLNSLGTTLDMWSPQREALAAHYFVVTSDTRGHGRSPVPAGPYTIAQMGQDVLALMDHLHLRSAHLCGLSLGGMVAQWLAVHAPGRVDHLILSNTAAKIGTPEGWNARIHQVQTQGMDSIVAGVIERWFTPTFRAQSSAAIAPVAAMLRATSPAGYTASCAAIRDMDQRADIARISAPTLILAGSQDQVTTLADAQAMQKSIPNSQLLALDAAHLANIEAAPAFTAAVLNFLQKGNPNGR